MLYVIEDDSIFSENDVKMTDTQFLPSLDASLVATKSNIQAIVKSL
jgi:hypothetical protein